MASKTSTKRARKAKTGEAVKIPTAEEYLREYGTKSAAIRALHAEGIPTADIARRLGIIYQHVRNVLKRPLKRKAA